MFNYTAQHILVMRLITQFEIDSPKTVHNFLFLASAESLDYLEIGFYDFVRSKQSAFSPSVQSILEELTMGRFLSTNPLRLTSQGLETYYALSGALRPFEQYINRCLEIFFRYKSDLKEVDSAILSHLRFRRVKQGKKLFDFSP